MAQQREWNNKAKLNSFLNDIVRVGSVKVPGTSLLPSFSVMSARQHAIRAEMIGEVVWTWCRCCYELRIRLLGTGSWLAAVVAAHLKSEPLIYTTLVWL